MAYGFDVNCYYNVYYVLSLGSSQLDKDVSQWALRNSNEIRTQTRSIDTSNKRGILFRKGLDCGLCSNWDCNRIIDNSRRDMPITTEGSVTLFDKEKCIIFEVHKGRVYLRVCDKEGEIVYRTTEEEFWEFWVTVRRMLEVGK